MPDKAHEREAVEKRAEVTCEDADEEQVRGLRVVACHCTQNLEHSNSEGHYQQKRFEDSNNSLHVDRVRRELRQCKETNYGITHSLTVSPKANCAFQQQSQVADPDTISKPTAQRIAPTTPVTFGPHLSKSRPIGAEKP